MSARPHPLPLLVAALASGACAGLTGGLDPEPPRTLPRVERSGYVVAGVGGALGDTSFNASVGFSESIVFADFIPSPRRTAGPCVVSDFGGTTVPADAPPPRSRPTSAGTVTLFNGRDPLSLTPDALAQYPYTYQTSGRWRPGDRVRVEAAGDEVPAFSHTLTMPSAPAVLSPTVASSSERVTWVRGQPFVVRRRPGTSGTFTVTFNQNTVVQRGASVRIGLPVIVSCAFPAATEVATVPAAALSDYVPSSIAADLRTIVFFTTTENAALTAGDYRVSVRAEGRGPTLNVEVR